MDEALKQKVLNICKTLDDKKASEIMALYVADKTIVADWFVICSGRAVPHVKTLCEELEEKAEALGLDLRRREGYSEGRWIVLDFSDILVHIFQPDERAYYNMERLWMDAKDGFINYSAEYGDKA
ncbi:MAG: ribosome silencing factor [Clostridiaceae bacterium]|nr:ribosome silencing factor [Eubacteriales bacterium]